MPDRVDLGVVLTKLEGIERLFEERFENIKERFDNVGSRFNDLTADIQRVEKNISDHEQHDEQMFVTKDEHTPIKNVVYGMVSIILLLVLSSIVYLVISGRGVKP